MANYTPGAGKLSVILIDRSASMAAADGAGGRTRLDEAKRQAEDLVDGMAKGGQATVIAFDDAPEVVQTFTGDTQRSERAIDRHRDDRPADQAEAGLPAGRGAGGPHPRAEPGQRQADRVPVQRRPGRGRGAS